MEKEEIKLINDIPFTLDNKLICEDLHKHKQKLGITGLLELQIIFINQNLDDYNIVSTDKTLFKYTIGEFELPDGTVHKCVPALILNYPQDGVANILIRLERLAGKSTRVFYALCSISVTEIRDVLKRTLPQEVQEYTQELADIGGSLSIFRDTGTVPIINSQNTLLTILGNEDNLDILEVDNLIYASTNTNIRNLSLRISNPSFISMYWTAHRLSKLELYLEEAEDPEIIAERLIQSTSITHICEIHLTKKQFIGLGYRFFFPNVYQYLDELYITVGNNFRYNIDKRGNILKCYLQCNGEMIETARIAGTFKRTTKGYNYLQQNFTLPNYNAKDRDKYGQTYIEDLFHSCNEQEEDSCRIVSIEHIEKLLAMHKYYTSYLEKVEDY